MLLIAIQDNRYKTWTDGLSSSLVIVHHFSRSIFTSLRRGQNGDFCACFIDRESDAQRAEASCSIYTDSKFMIFENVCS